MTSVVKLALQAILYATFAVVTAYLSVYPTYRYADADNAQLKLSLSHAAKRVKPCVKLTAEQLADLAANMRQPEKCERERLPVTVELDVDGELRFRVVATPSGLWNDGPSSIYERFEIDPGDYTITARLRDSSRLDGWDYVRSERVSLVPGRYFTITFRAETGGFNFR